MKSSEKGLGVVMFQISSNLAQFISCTSTFLSSSVVLIVSRHQVMTLLRGDLNCLMYFLASFSVRYFVYVLQVLIHSDRLPLIWLEDNGEVCHCVLFACLFFVVLVCFPR